MAFQALLDEHVDKREDLGLVLEELGEVIVRINTPE